MRLAGLLVLAFFAAPAEAAVAQPSVSEMAAMPLDALLDMQVTGASRVAQRMSDAPASVTVITADEIRAFGYRSIADALRSARGLSVNYDRLYSYLSVRAFYAPGDYNTRVLLLVDGNRVNDNLYDQAFLGQEAPVDMDRIERIEFIPGQGSAVYGANAFFGVINVVTRSSSKESSSLGLSVASGGTYEARAAIRGGGGADGTSWLLSAVRRTSRGADLFFPEKQVPGASDGWAHGTDYERRSSVRWAVEAGTWKLNLLLSDRLKGVGAPVDIVLGDARSSYRDTLTLLDVSKHSALAPDLEVDSRAFMGRYRFVGDYVLDYPPLTVNRDDDLGRWYGFETRVTTTRLQSHTIQLGVEYQHSGTIVFKNFDRDDSNTRYLDSTATGGRVAVFAEDRFELGQAWLATAGLRVDRESLQPTQAHPRLALVHRPAPAWVLKAIYGTAFRPPNAFERDYQVLGPGGYERNPTLKPERVKGVEVVAEWTPQANAKFTASAHQSRAAQLIVLQAIPDSDRYMFLNLGALRMSGVELEGQWHNAGGVRLRVNYSQEHASGAAKDTFGVYSPQQMAKVTLMAPLAAAWTLGLEGQAIGRRGAAAGYSVVNLTLSSRLAWQRAALSFSAFNALDRRFSDPGSVPQRQPVVVQDGRVWQLKLNVPY